MRRFLPGVLLACALSCSPRDIPNALTAIDVVGKSTAKVLGWCEANGTDSRVAQARDAFEKEDYLSAALVLHQVFLDLKSQGKEPDADVTQAEMLVGALAAEGVQDGMRAISLPKK